MKHKIFPTYGHYLPHKQYTPGKACLNTHNHEAIRCFENTLLILQFPKSALRGINILAMFSMSAFLELFAKVIRLSINLGTYLVFPHYSQLKDVFYSNV